MAKILVTSRRCTTSRGASSDSGRRFLRAQVGGRALRTHSMDERVFPPRLTEAWAENRGTQARQTHCAPHGDSLVGIAAMCSPLTRAHWARYRASSSTARLSHASCCACALCRLLRCFAFRPATRGHPSRATRWAWAACLARRRTTSTGTTLTQVGRGLRL